MMTKPHIRYIGPHWVCSEYERRAKGSITRSAPGMTPSQALRELRKLCPQTPTNKSEPAP